MLYVAIVWHGESDFETYNNFLVTQFGWHDSAFMLASDWVLILAVDQWIQSAKLAVDFILFWQISQQLINRRR